MRKELYFYNLCNEDISYRKINKVIKCGINATNIIDMSLSMFTKLYGMNSSKFLKKLKELASGNCKLDNLSLYSLIEVGITPYFIIQIIEKGLKNVLELYLCPRNILINKYGFSDNQVDKLEKALINLDIDENDIDQDSIGFRDVLLNVENNTDYIKELKQSIFEIISNLEEDSISYFELLKLIPKKYQYSSKILESIKLLIEEKKIEFSEFGIKKHILCLKDFLEILKDDINKEFLIEYLNGKTYEEIGLIHGKISRERVRQRINKIVFPKLQEFLKN